MAAKIREIVLDTETTGLYCNNGDRIIEIGCVEIVNKVRTGAFYHAYINPERDIPMESFNVHGISEEFLKDKPIFRKVADEFLEFIGNSPLVIHNAGFDMGFINAELELLCKPHIPKGRVIDTLNIARKKHPGSPASLDALCKRFGISLESRDLHGALIDAELLAQVYIELMGGAQSSLSLENKTNEVTIEIKRQVREKRDFPLDPKIEEAHQNFLKSKIPEAKWNKLYKTT